MQTWMPDLIIPVGSDSVLDYSLDFTDWLEGDTISSVTATVSNCTMVNLSHGEGDVVTFRITGMSANAGFVVLRVVTTAGQVENFKIRFGARRP